MAKKNLLPMIPLFLVIAVDSMGLGILFPILSSMLIDPHSTFLPAQSSEFLREFTYGLVIGIYMIAWFFGAAMLGDLSDVIGRKKALMICLLGASIGYFISGVAIFWHSVAFLIIGRIVAGFTAGSQPIAQAAIVDVSDDDSRAKNIGYVLLTVSLGFVLGPFIGGFLSDSQFGQWFTYATPMFFAAIVSLFNCVLLGTYFKETFVVTRQVKIRVYYAIQIFIEAFQSKKIRMLSLVLLLFISGWGEYFGFVAQFLLRRFHYSSLETSLFITVLSIGFSIGFALLVDFFSRRFALKQCVIVSSIVAAVISLITALTHHPIVAWVGALIVGMSIAVAYSMLITIFSNQVDDTQQGWVMGVTNAVMALSFGVTTFLSGFATEFGEAVPLYWAFLGLIIAGVLMCCTHLSKGVINKHTTERMVL